AVADLYQKQKETSKLSAIYAARFTVAENLLHEKGPNTVAQKAFNQREYAEAARLYLQAVNDLTGISADSGINPDPLKAYQLITDNPNLSLDSLVDVVALDLYAHTIETCLELVRKSPPPPNVLPISRDAPALIKRARGKLADVNAIRQQQAEQYQQPQQRRAP
ncbi:MAG TPA: hypothetical protein VHP99_10580, partial [Pyrinomonadaceae bacterium]|nr:hypothetical protein [Pyrinomonadaceae bacterium]